MCVKLEHWCFVEETKTQNNPKWNEQSLYGIQSPNCSNYETSSIHIGRVLEMKIRSITELNLARILGYWKHASTVWTPQKAIVITSFILVLKVYFIESFFVCQLLLSKLLLRENGGKVNEHLWLPPPLLLKLNHGFLSNWKKQWTVHPMKTEFRPYSGNSILYSQDWKKLFRKTVSYSTRIALF